MARRGLRWRSTWGGADAGAEWSLAAMERSSWEQRGRRGWSCGAAGVGGKGAAVDPPAGTSTVESEIESWWGRAVGLAAWSEALGL